MKATFKVFKLSKNVWAVIQMLWPERDILENPIVSFKLTERSALVESEELNALGLSLI